VLTFLNEFIFPGFFRALWTIMFGILIIFHQLKWKSMINKYFGFLNMWYARGAFFIFVSAWSSDPRPARRAAPLPGC
jgi:ABC-type sugar transport system permease subunit